MYPYCLDVGQLAGIVLGTAAGTIVVVLVFVFLFVWSSRRQRLKVTFKDHVISESPKDTCTAPHAQQSRCVLFDDNPPHDDQEQGGKFGQSILLLPIKDESSEDQVITITEKDPPKTYEVNGSQANKILEDDLIHTEYTKSRSSSDAPTLQTDISDHSTTWIYEKKETPEILQYTITGEEFHANGLELRGIANEIFILNKSSRRDPKIAEGDRIISMKINFDNITPETAIALLKCARNCAITLELQRSHMSAADSNYNKPINFGRFQKSASFGDMSTLQIDQRPLGHEMEKYDYGAKFKSVPYLPDVEQEKIPDFGTIRHMIGSLPNEKIKANPIDPDQDIEINQNNMRPLVNGIIHVDPIQTPDHYQEIEMPLDTIESTPNGIIQGDLDPDPDQEIQVHQLHYDNPKLGLESPASTITAEIRIHKSDQKFQESKKIDPYEGLSHEDRMQVIRLSYEESDLSRSTPNLSTSPSSEKCNKTEKPEEKFELPPKSALSKIPVPKAINRKRRTTALNDLELLRPTSTQSKLLTNGTKIPGRKTTGNGLKNGSHHRCSLVDTSGSGSSLITTDEDRVSSPETCRNGVVLNPALREEMEQEQLEKLLYFQQQLEKQQSELARLGVQIPTLQMGK